MPRRSVLGPFFVLLAMAGCGGSGSDTQAEPPCVVHLDAMAEILGRDEVFAVPQADGVRCIYGVDEQPLVTLSVRTPEQFQAERDRFEQQGIELPDLVEVEFESAASVDPRYNSLNVTAGDRIVSVEVVGVEPSDLATQLELEKEIARVAVDAL